MKNLFRIILVIFILQLSNYAFTQNLTQDTIKANEFTRTAVEYFNKNSFDTAIVNYEKASLLFEKQKLWTKYLSVETRIAECFRNKWELDISNKRIKDALKKSLLHINKVNDAVANSWFVLGVNYYYQTKLDSTSSCWNEAIDICKVLYGEESPDVASGYNNLGLVCELKNDNDSALYYYNRSLNLNKKIYDGIHREIALNYANMANVYADINEFELSIENHLKALEMRKELFGSEHIEVAETYHNLGFVYTQKKEYDLALQYHKKALQLHIVLHTEKHRSVASAYHNIGFIYKNIQEYDKALEYLYKALEIQKELLGEENGLIGKIYLTIGGAYRLKKDYDSAQENYNKAKPILINSFGEKHFNTAICYSAYGKMYEDKTEYDSAHFYYNKYLSILNDIYGSKHAYIADCYNSLGRVYRNQANYDSALIAFQKGIISNLKNFKGTINFESVPPEDDYFDWDFLLSSLKAKAEIFAITANAGPNSEMKNKLNSSLIHYQACDKFISKIRREMKSKADKMYLGNYSDAVYNDAVEICYKLSELSESKEDKNLYKSLVFYFSERNKSSVLLEALAGSEAQKFVGISDSLLEKERKLQTDIAYYKKILAENIDSLKSIRFNDKLFIANRTYDSLIIVFEKKYPKYFDLKYNQVPAGVNTLQNILDKKTTILSYMVGDSLISISAISSKKFDVLQFKKPKNFKALIEELRENISNTSAISDDYNNNTNYSVLSYQKSSHQLYELLFPDELKKFLSKKIKNLIIIPDSWLATVPFEALLKDKYSGTWTDWNNTSYFTEMPFLIKDYNISYSYSGNLFCETLPKTKDRPEFQNINDWLALAPVFDNDSISGTDLRTRKLIETNSTDKSGNINTRSFLRDGTYISPLPGSEEETKTIFEIFESNNRKAVLKTHKYANEEYVKSGILKDFKYLHIATHGMVNEDKPELSCILLAQDSTSSEDNILFSDEIYNLELNADLTVLSACETGLGKIAEGEGVIGLTRALLYAGSKNIIVSLWQVSDESTSQLMVDFYKNIFRNDKDGFSENLTKSKLKLINEGKFAHPFFWSPFVLIGK